MYTNQQISKLIAVEEAKANYEREKNLAIDSLPENVLKLKLAELQANLED